MRKKGAEGTREKGGREKGKKGTRIETRIEKGRQMKGVTLRGYAARGSSCSTACAGEWSLMTLLTTA